MREQEHTPQELAGRHIDITRDFIFNSFEANYNALKGKRGFGILAKFNLASSKEPRVIDFMSPNGLNILVPYFDLDREFLSVFFGDVKPGFNITEQREDVTIKEENLGRLPDALSSYVDQSVMAIVCTYNLKNQGDFQKRIKWTTFFSGESSRNMIAELWSIEDIEPSLLGDEFGKVVPKDHTSEEPYPFPIDNPYLIELP